MTQRESMTFQVPGHLLLTGTSLLLIVLASSIALLQGREDQTGETTAAIVTSFQAALATPLRRTPVPPETAATFTNSSIQGRAANRENWLPLLSLDENEFPTQSEPTLPQDHSSRERMLFRNTFIELQRFSDVVTSEILRPQDSFEIGFSPVRTGDAVALQIADAICQANADARRRNTEWELTVWSTTPADSAWIRAAREADQMKRRVTELVTSRGRLDVRITANSRLWVSRTSPRPRMTVTVRQRIDVPHTSTGP